MRAGRANQTVSIQRSVNTFDDYGQEIKTFETVQNLRAEVKTVSESERISGGKYDGRTQYKVTSRYTDIDKKDRLLWGSTVLEIIDVLDPSMRRRELVMRCASDE